MLSIEMLPAQYGDCLWIEYGDEHQPSRVLIDCGMKATYRLLGDRLAASPDITFELLVLTHVDADHIQGSIPLLQEFGPERFRDVWFNGWKHLPDDDRLGPVQAEVVSALLETRGFPWNAAWGGRAVVIPEDGDLPTHTLPGGLKLTLLSPTRERLVALRKKWKKILEEEDMTPGSTGDALRVLESRRVLQPDRLGPTAFSIRNLARQKYEPDDGPGNGSSIALLAEYGSKALLLAGDAFAPLLEQTIRQLLGERPRLKLDACKLSHHGSRGNTSPGLLRLISCSRFLVSTNGSCYHHPHPETLARIIDLHRIIDLRGKPRFYFNYRSEENEIWGNPILQREYDFRVYYPESGAEGYKLVL